MLIEICGSQISSLKKRQRGSRTVPHKINAAASLYRPFHFDVINSVRQGVTFVSFPSGIFSQTYKTTAILKRGEL